MADSGFVPPPSDSPQAFIQRLAEFLSEVWHAGMLAPVHARDSGDVLSSFL